MIDVTKVKSLREKTGAGVNECCKALDESKGNLVKAESWLKARGIEKAAKKEGRETRQGIVESYIHHQGKIGVLVELNCETDFVARTDDFRKLAHELAMQISAMDPKNVDELLKQEYIRDPQMTVSDLVKQTIAKIGENIQVTRFSRIALGE
ncbi:MAG: Elongation factor Ts [Candidatus Gottesmanbacteria bacterium GW2011_GWA1_43_11]|uniref:Elongation factor Ts n=1 Tax=Candidatus Gottesmanbacteria bacterium GW2011_GWA1_43_11 TaxID=1618436 RepID=A0A0G1CHA0_9BACT|nr:MAG: Elongation factor Ts [Candidatus Gottesmanbacteria bacterium GW2011_GWA1_43_11]